MSELIFTIAKSPDGSCIGEVLSLEEVAMLLELNTAEVSARSQMAAALFMDGYQLNITRHELDDPTEQDQLETLRSALASTTEQLAKVTREKRDGEERHAQLQARCYEGFPSASDGIFDAFKEALAELRAAKEKLDALPADWSIDSSLETWFPITAETIKKQELELRTLQTVAKQAEDALAMIVRIYSETLAQPDEEQATSALAALRAATGQGRPLTEDGRRIPPIEGDLPCGEYDPAGPGAGIEPDGFVQCAQCGHPKSSHSVLTPNPHE